MTITVYVADDHAVVSDGLISLLMNQEDIEVIGSASDGSQAISDVPAKKPDVVIMDISMPKLNGIDAAARIINSCKCTRVIILSIHADPEHISRSLQAGVHGYLLKECAGREVVQAIRRVYAGHRYLSRKVSGRIIDDYIEKRMEKYHQPTLETLSTRELETLRMVADGKSSAEIAESLGLSKKTVETYRSRLMNKLRIRNIPNLVKFAISHGLTTVEP
ncbi:MAG: response regulator transcription factor [Desulfobacterales bacterium]